MFKKAQAATEYLIILAVVIIIALIVIGVMGGIPGLGTSGKSKVSESYWGSQSVGLDAYAVDSTGNFRVTMRNNGRNTISVSRVEIGASGANGYWNGGGTAVSIPSGSTATVAATAIQVTADRCTLGRSYSYTANITYTDSSSGSVNIKNINLEL